MSDDSGQCQVSVFLPSASAFSVPVEEVDGSTAPDSSLTAVTERVYQLNNRSASSSVVTSETLLQELVPLSVQQRDQSTGILWRTVYVTVVRRR